MFIFASIFTKSRWWVYRVPKKPQCVQALQETEAALCSEAAFFSPSVAELGKPQRFEGSEKRGASQGPKADLALYFLATHHHFPAELRQTLQCPSRRRTSIAG